MSRPLDDSAPSRVSETRALLWKEFRQVTPLLMTVLGLGFGSLLIIMITAAFATHKRFSYDSGFWFLFLSMPMMYATGVGILLVGTEKESRSMQWMRSLPVDIRAIARNKLFVALVTLGLVWLIAWVSWAVFASLLGVNPFQSQSLDIYGMNAGRWMLPTYVMVSLFLCFSGIAFAWKCESQILSLILLVPAAFGVWCIAYVLASFYAESKSGFEFRNTIDSGLYLLSLAVGSLIAFLYGWRASQHELAALSPPVHESGSTGMTSSILGAFYNWGTRSESRLAEAWSLWPSVTPQSGMLWQMVRQNGRWWSLIGISFLVVLAGGAFLDIMGTSGASAGPIDDAWFAWVIFPIGFLSGLLGVLAFQSDGIQQRVRFYADRGVSPTLLWVTRHWIPVTILLGFAVVRYITLRSHHSIKDSWILVDTAVVLGISLASYIVGQWVSQFIKSPILSAIVLPAVLFVQLVYCVFAVVAMESPWWLLFASFAIIMTATWWMMRPWMERRIDWLYYLQHSGFILVALIVPLVPGLWKIWSLPSMPSELRANLEQLAIRNPVARQTRPFFISSHYLTTQSGRAVTSAVLNHNEELRESQRKQIVAQAVNIDFWIEASDAQELLKAYLAELAGLQNAVERLADVSASDGQGSLKSYRSAMADIPKLVIGLRGTRRLRFCDLAERIELTALGHCKHSKAREWMGEAVYESVARLLEDGRSRDEARRVALANAWWESFRGSESSRVQLAYSLDGYPVWYLADELIMDSQRSSIPSSLAMLRSRDLLVSHLWKLLEFPVGSDQAIAYREMIHSGNMYSNRMTVDGQFITFDDYQVLSPAETWRGEWEELAKKLGTKGASRE